MLISLLMSLLQMANSAHAVDVRVKNFREIPYSLEAVTGISRLYPEIKTYYNNKISVFPQMGVVTEITPPFLVTQYSYSSFFCQRLVEQDAKKSADQRWLHQGIDFSKTPSSWNQSTRNQLLSDYANVFWQRELDTTEQKILNDGLDQLITQQPNNAASAKPVLMSLCVIYASNFQFLVK